MDFDALVLGPCIAAFGEVAQGYPLPVYAPAPSQPGPPVTFGIDGVFDAGFLTVNEFLAPQVSTVQPTFGLRLSEVPPGITLAQGDQVTIRGTLYDVRDVQPDSHGHARVMLNKAAT